MHNLFTQKIRTHQTQILKAICTWQLQLERWNSLCHSNCPWQPPVHLQRAQGPSQDTNETWKAWLIDRFKARTATMLRMWAGSIVAAAAHLLVFFGCRLLRTLLFKFQGSVSPSLQVSLIQHNFARSLGSSMFTTVRILSYYLIHLERWCISLAGSVARQTPSPCTQLVQKFRARNVVANGFNHFF